ncbi:MAG: hypothetical protein J6P21_02600 [Clostridia bacterium]|nr:hypothetical protein [Clostridia bacterium]
MLGKVWAGMIISSFFCALINNKINLLGNAILEGTDQAINIILITSGAIIFWSGIMKIAQDSGFTRAISKLLFPVLRILFPDYAQKNNILDFICINFVSNIMGLNNAATPSGIKAIKFMQNMNEISKKKLLEKNAAIFLIMNMSCIQIAPTFLVALRKSFGSNTPYEILPKMWATSIIFLLTGIILIKIFLKNKNKQKNNIIIYDN